MEMCGLNKPGNQEPGIITKIIQKKLVKKCIGVFACLCVKRKEVGQIKYFLGITYLFLYWFNDLQI